MRLALLPFIVLASVGVSQEIHIRPAPSRFELAAPLPSIAPIRADGLGNGVGYAQQLARSRGLQGRILWVDGTANIDRTNGDEKIAELMRRIKQSGFNTVVYDIKPISGHTMYPSAIAPKMLEWKGKQMPVDFDPLNAMVREAKANGLPLIVSLNAFSEGHSLFKVGPGYEMLEHQSVICEAQPYVYGSGSRFALQDKANVALTEGSIGVYTDSSKLPPRDASLFAVSIDRDGTVVDGFESGGIGVGVPTIPAGGAVLAGSGDAASFLRYRAAPGTQLRFDTEARFRPLSERPDLQYPLMMNPHDPFVQERALSIVREVLSKYAVDGLMYDDRLRFAGMYADFSESTRKLFEDYVGKALVWPDDVFKVTISVPKMSRGIRPGAYYDAWLTWRALVMRNWVATVRSTVQSVRPGATFGAYGGSWYGDYAALGTNYAAPDLDAGFWFLTRDYAKTGFAGLLDLLVTGCYYPTATILDAMEKGSSMGSTVEAAGQLSNRVANDQCWTYAGIMLSQFKGDPSGLERALQAACASTQGVMVFDLSHDIEPMWPVFAKAFSTPALAPHSNPKFLREVRERRMLADRAGYRPGPVSISTGAAGTGF